MTYLVVLLIRIYQVLLSPLLGPSCRFEPSCSRYAIACVETHGVLHGLWLSIKRISRCHPFHPGGYDPPPGARNDALYAAAAGCREHSR
jgi:hypothetical protein